MVVRWIGAFGKSSSLSESLSWELSQNEREVAAEHINGNQGTIRHAKVGLLWQRAPSFALFRVTCGPLPRTVSLKPPVRQRDGARTTPNVFADLNIPQLF